MSEFSLKPMISRAGMLASRKSQYYLRAISKLLSKDILPELTPTYKSSKLPEIRVLKPKKNKSKGTFSFKSVGRVDKDTSNSPGPNRYTPNFEYLYKRSPKVVFRKHIVRDALDSRSNNSHEPSKSAVPLVSRSVELKKPPGIPFEKQICRKTIYIGENAHEKRFEREPHSSFTRLHKIHSFSSYTARKPLYHAFEHQPEYTPKYHFISKRFKSNHLVD